MSEEYRRPSGSPPYWPVGTQIVWREGDGPLGTGATVVDTSVPHFAQPMTVVRDDSEGLVVWLPTGTPVLRAARADGLSKRDDQSTLFTAALVQERGVHADFDQLRIALTGRPWSVWVFFTEGTGEFAGWYVNLEKPHIRDEHTVYTSDHVLDLSSSRTAPSPARTRTNSRSRSRKGSSTRQPLRRSRRTPRRSKPWSPTGVHHSATAGNASDPTLAGPFLGCLRMPEQPCLGLADRETSALVTSRRRCCRYVSEVLTTRARCRLRSAFKVTCAGRTFRIRSKTCSRTAEES